MVKGPHSPNLLLGAISNSVTVQNLHGSDEPLALRSQPLWTNPNPKWLRFRIFMSRLQAEPESCMHCSKVI